MLPKPFLLIAGIFAIISITLVVFILFSLWGARTETAVPKASQLTPLSRAQVGETKSNELDTLPNLQSKKQLPNGATEYSFPSYLSDRPDVVHTQDGIAIFERVETPAYPNQKGFALISQYVSKYGEPEKVVTGSEYFGTFASTFIYASKGFTIIGNQATDEVFEIQTYRPMSVENYQSLFGHDINPGPPHREYYDPVR